MAHRESRSEMLTTLGELLSTADDQTLAGIAESLLGVQVNVGIGSCFGILDEPRPEPPTNLATAVPETLTKAMDLLDDCIHYFDFNECYDGCSRMAKEIDEFIRGIDPNRYTVEGSKKDK